MHKLSPGDRVCHRRRDEYGTYLATVKADPSGDIVLVRFDDGDEERVSRDQLSKVIE